MWDIVDYTRSKAMTTMQIKKKDKNNAIATKIIKQGVNSNLYINVISKEDLPKFRETLWHVYLQFGQRVIYSILKKLLNHSCVTKLLGYEKKATAIFVEENTLYNAFKEL